jgi:hypothetical protein
VPVTADGLLAVADLVDRFRVRLAADPGLRAAQLPGRIADTFGVRVHPRSVERALARRRERHSKSRGTTRPPDAEGG